MSRSEAVPANSGGGLLLVHESPPVVGPRTP
jgi:hypothetical protein